MAKKVGFLEYETKSTSKKSKTRKLKKIEENNRIMKFRRNSEKSLIYRNLRWYPIKVLDFLFKLKVSLNQKMIIFKLNTFEKLKTTHPKNFKDRIRNPVFISAILQNKQRIKVGDENISIKGLVLFFKPIKYQLTNAAKNLELN